MKKQTNYILICVISVLLVFLTVASIIKPDVRMSENENRYLTKAPELDFGDILNGSFEEQLEEYLSDQIIGRESWIKLTMGSMKALGSRDANGVYFLHNGGLSERIIHGDFNYKRFFNNLDSVKELKEGLDGSGVDLDLMLVPTSSWMYQFSQNLSTNFHEGLTIAAADKELGDTLIDLRDDLLAEDKEYYFRTDHHWNYNGAELAYRKYMERVTGKTPEEKTPETLTDDFMGTLYSKVLLDMEGDTIKVPSDSLDLPMEVTIEDETYDSIYFMDRLENKDKYEVFLGGNYDRVDIKLKDQGAADRPKLLIVKDSYANSFVPFLLKDFGEITLVDTRYFRGSVKDLALDEGYDRVLILYNTNNFSQEKMALTSKLLQ